MRGELAGHEFSEEAHSLRFSRLALRQYPERSVHADVTAW